MLIKIESVAQLDPTSLSQLAEIALQAKHGWLAYRLSQKAGVALATNQGALRAGDNGLSNRLRAGSQFESHELSQGSAIALNYILEFVHNLQRDPDLLEKISPQNIKILTQAMLHSLPHPTESYENLINVALKSAIGRIHTTRPELQALDKIG